MFDADALSPLANPATIPHQIMTFAVRNDHLDFHSSSAFDASKQLGQRTLGIVVHG
jgi:hypothetical protein